jgi:hypothetical protein
MKRFAAVLVLFVSIVQPAAAQSLFGTSGLGLPLAPVDARARALGGIGVGLFDFNPSLVNPAEVAGVRWRGVVAAYQPTANKVSFGGETDDIGGTTFPLIRVLYPVNERLIASVGYGGVLDQSWSVVSESEVVLGKDTVATLDNVNSAGGISQLQVGVAYQVLPSLALGFAAGLHTGDLLRTTTREFPDSLGGGLRTFESRQEWSYNGPVVAFGARWDLRDVVRVGASYTWAGDLDADSISGGAPRTFDIPSYLAIGASARLAPRLTATLGMRSAAWSSAGGSGGVDAQDVTEIGGGLEWEGASAGERRFPLRIGYHRGDLPFNVQGADAKESSWSIGAGARMAMTEDGPLARLDAGLERGSRTATTLSEDFWRVTVSLALFGR